MNILKMESRCWLVVEVCAHQHIALIQKCDVIKIIIVYALHANY